MVSDVWADYIITEVYYDSTETLIKQVKLQRDLGESIESKMYRVPRGYLKFMMEFYGLTFAFVKVDTSANNKLKFSDPKFVNLVNGYFRTDSCSIEKDEL